MVPWTQSSGTSSSGHKETRPVNVAGLLLTGGASRRMGSDKALLELDGRRLVDRAAAVLNAVAAPVIEVGPGWAPGLACVGEDPPGSGPLAALWAGAGALRAMGDRSAVQSVGGRPAEAVLLLAVDMPAVSARLLRFLAEWPGAQTVVPTSGGHPQPLCARYGVDALAAIPGLLSNGQRSLRSLLVAVEDRPGGIDWVGPDQWQRVAGGDAFCDLDTPGDLRRYLASSSEI
jgi:molybdenum cofactor guanylyltransferase